MTDQRRFPFFVNGRFWRFMNVEKSILCKGFVYIPVSKKPKHIYTPYPTPITMKQIVFQLVECGEQKHHMIAHWVQGFWVIDPDLELDNEGCLYLKEMSDG